MKKLLLLVSGGLLALSVMLIREQVQTIVEVKSVSIPLVAEVTNLERRHKILSEQVELTELSNAMRIRTMGEHLDAYVLPTDTDSNRLILFFEILRDELSKQKVLSSMSDISIGEPVEREGVDLETRSLSVDFTVHEHGLRFLVTLFELGGLITVGDALGDQEIEAIFQSTEDENPAGIVALEQFLSLDVLTYAKDKRSHVQKLKASFVSPVFERTLDEILANSRLVDAERIFAGSFGDKVREEKLWPLQFLTVNKLKTTKGGAVGWYRLDVEGSLWERE